MLQVAARSSGYKHKALLMSPKPPTDSMKKPDFRDSSSLYPGDAYQRMCLDPELIRTKTQLIIGSAIVVLLIVAAAVIQWPDVWPKATSKVVMTPTEPIEVPQVPSKNSSGSQAILPTTSKTVQIMVPPKRLAFQPAKTAPTEQVDVSDTSQNVLESFLAATSVDEKLSFSVQTPRIEAAMRKYYNDHPVGAIPYLRIEKVSGSPADYAEFRVVLRDGTKKFAAVISTSAGFRVDWASFVALGDLEWERMRMTRPTTPVLMRVVGSLASRFTGPFSDDARLLCLRLLPASDSAAAPVYGYVPKDSDIALQLQGWLAREASEGTPLTLRLCYPSQTNGYDQVWITELVVPGWVHVASGRSAEGE